MDTPSESSSAQTTSTSTTDARVGADNNAVVIQAGGQQNISFSPEVGNLASNVTKSIVDFSGNVLNQAKSIITESMMTQQQAIEGALNFGAKALAASPVTPAAASQNITSGLNLSTLKPVYIVGAIGGVVLLFLLLKRK